MKKTLAVTAAMLLACSVTFGQTTGDKNKKNESVSKPAAQKTTATPASKVELNPQPLPPGAKKTTTSPESKVALNPQPLPPGAKKTGEKKTTSHVGEKSKKGSTGSTQSPK